jgi:hypothetical protein
MENHLDLFIKETVEKAMASKILPDQEYANSDNLAEIIEKLIILHIRVWHMEDDCFGADDVTLANLKRKIDICFKSKRPKYLEAINKIVQDCVIREKEIYEPSVKHYNGFNK